VLLLLVVMLVGWLCCVVIWYDWSFELVKIVKNKNSMLLLVALAPRNLANLSCRWILIYSLRSFNSSLNVLSVWKKSTNLP
jgi:hypothetical protein